MEMACTLFIGVYLFCSPVSARGSLEPCSGCNQSSAFRITFRIRVLRFFSGHYGSAEASFRVCLSGQGLILRNNGTCEKWRKRLGTHLQPLVEMLDDGKRKIGAFTEQTQEMLRSPGKLYWISLLSSGFIMYRGKKSYDNFQIQVQADQKTGWQKDHNRIGG